MFCDIAKQRGVSAREVGFPAPRHLATGKIILAMKAKLCALERLQTERVILPGELSSGGQDEVDMPHLLERRAYREV